ncbi:MAG: ERF family protein, partial [Burkholderiales bacterium]
SAARTACDLNHIKFHFEDINKEDRAGVIIHLRHLPSEQSYWQECLVDKTQRSPQAVGGCYTYAKRYLLASLFLMSHPELDDDGELAEGRQKTDKPVPVEKVNKIKQELKKLGIQEATALESVGLKDWSEITTDHANKLLGKISARKQNAAAN